MKVCNNCGTTNDLRAHKCVQCHMPDQFTLIGDEPPVGEAAPETKTQCSNCGTYAVGNGSNCQECHFPIAQDNSQEGVNSTHRDQLKRDNTSYDHLITIHKPLQNG